jgi:hypothetical protein
MSKRILVVEDPEAETGALRTGGLICQSSKPAAAF